MQLCPAILASVPIPRPPARKHRNRVRIIGGEWRSRVIEFPDQASTGLRPTPDRVRETVFNWLGQTLHDQRCLDLFAGSGALGFEAASRGAASVVMVENERHAFAALESNRKKLNATTCRIVQVDALKFLATHADRHDVIFVDPPFTLSLLPKLLPLLAAKLAEGGVIYAECGEALADVLAKNAITALKINKVGRAGASHFALLSLV